MAFDFKALHAGLMRNNVGLGGVRIRATVTIEKGMIKIKGTGQGYSLRGEAPTEPGPTRQWLRFVNWLDPVNIGAEIE